MNAVTLKKLEKLKSTYKDGLEDLLSDVSNKKARVPIETNRLFDMKKMLLGEVLMTDRLLSGLEMALKKLLRCRVVRHTVVVLIYIFDIN